MRQLCKASIICSSVAMLSLNMMGQQPAGKNVSGPDRAFAIMAAETDMAEIQISKMAEEKASSDEVKKLAQKLMEDHTKSSDAMKQIASAKGLPLPDKTDSKHEAIATRLEGESGAQFDKDFLSSNSKDHHRVIAAFKKESMSGNDPEIKAFAKEFLPAIQEHSKMIDKAMASNMGSGMMK